MTENHVNTRLVKEFIIFDNDCSGTDIDDTFSAADAYIFVHIFPSVVPLPAAGRSAGESVLPLQQYIFFILA